MDYLKTLASRPKTTWHDHKQRQQSRAEWNNRIWAEIEPRISEISEGNTEYWKSKFERWTAREKRLTLKALHRERMRRILLWIPTLSVGWIVLVTLLSMLDITIRGVPSLKISALTVSSGAFYLASLLLFLIGFISKENPGTPLPKKAAVMLLVVALWLVPVIVASRSSDLILPGVEIVSAEGGPVVDESGRTAIVTSLIVSITLFVSAFASLTFQRIASEALNYINRGSLGDRRTFLLTTEVIHRLDQPRPFEFQSDRSRMASTLEALARCIQLELAGLSAISGRPPETTLDRHLKAANYVRNMKTWATLPQMTTRADMRSRIVSLLPPILTGQLHYLPQTEAEPTRQPKNRAIKSFLTILVSLIPSALLYSGSRLGVVPEDWREYLAIFSMMTILLGVGSVITPAASGIFARARELSNRDSNS